MRRPCHLRRGAPALGSRSWGPASPKPTPASGLPEPLATSSRASRVLLVWEVPSPLGGPERGRPVCRGTARASGLHGQTPVGIPHPRSDNHNCLQPLPNVSWGAESPPIPNAWPKEMSRPPASGEGLAGAGVASFRASAPLLRRPSHSGPSSSRSTRAGVRCLPDPTRGGWGPAGCPLRAEPHGRCLAPPRGGGPWREEEASSFFLSEERGAWWLAVT